MRKLKRQISGLIVGAIIGATLGVMLGGCGGVLRGIDEKAPSTIMRIDKVDARVLRVSYYDAKTNSMIPYSEAIHVNGQLEGWSITKYDWDKLIEQGSIHE